MDIAENLLKESRENSGAIVVLTTLTRAVGHYDWDLEFEPRFWQNLVTGGQSRDFSWVSESSSFQCLVQPTLFTTPSLSRHVISHSFISPSCHSWTQTFKVCGCLWRCYVHCYWDFWNRGQLTIQFRWVSPGLLTDNMNTGDVYAVLGKASPI